jgi:hypothetical protein
MLPRILLVAVKSSLVLLISFLWGCGLTMKSTDTITLEFDGPVDITYYPKSLNPNPTLDLSSFKSQSSQVTGQETFSLKNMGTSQSTLAYLGKDGDVFEVFPGTNAAWLQAYNTNLTSDQAGLQALAYAAGADFEMAKGQEAPIKIFSNLPIKFSGANLVKAIAPTYGPDGQFNTPDDTTQDVSPAQIEDLLTHQDMNAIVSQEYSGPITLVVKAAPVVGGVKGSGSTLPGGTSNTTTQPDSGDKSGCTLLSPSSTEPSTAWMWLAALGVTGWIAGRRLKVRAR